MSLASYIGIGELSTLFTQRPMSQRTTHSIVRRTARETSEQLGAVGRSLTENLAKKAPTKLYNQNAHYKRLSDKLGANSNPALKELVNRAGNGNNQFAKRFLAKTQAAIPDGRIEGMGQPEADAGYTANAIAEAATAALPPVPPTAAEAAAAAKAAKRAETTAKQKATRAANKATAAAAATAALEAARVAAAADAAPPTPAQAKEIKRLATAEKRAAKLAARAASGAAEAAAAAPAAAAAAAEPEGAEGSPEPAAASDGLKGDEKEAADAVEENSTEENSSSLVMASVAEKHPLLMSLSIAVNPETDKVEIYVDTAEQLREVKAALSKQLLSLKHHPKYKAVLSKLVQTIKLSGDSAPAAAVGGGGSEAAAAAPTAASAAVKAAVAADKKAKK